ncbi:hypothetical protein EUGRSUZ_E01650 [Eucalyptus grandis]|uniref:Uncharacterized protein n=2 Tax=Eucalyptus grandis TaxID=71139 RepID=A0ACC3KVQ9_EUCGR|nr:hypothetical protein EUGRSUZ_E01650 [Eucalyptus grandis]
MVHQHNHHVEPVVLHGEVKHGLLSSGRLFDRLRRSGEQYLHDIDLPVRSSIMQRDSSLPSLHGAQVWTHCQELPRDLDITSSSRDVQRAETIRVHLFRKLWRTLQELSNEIQMASHTSDMQWRVTGSFKIHLLEDELIAADQVFQLMDIALPSCF